MDTHRIIYLYRRFDDQTITAAEIEELNILLQNDQAEAILKTYWDLNWDQAAALSRKVTIKNYDPILEHILRQPQPKSQSILIMARNSWVAKIAVAASILAIIGITLFFYLTREQRIPTHLLTERNDISPGGNRATLSFNDGQTITLDESKDGIVFGETLKYHDGSRVDNLPRHIRNAVLRTPVGGQYKVVLPDGSHVWLNANSSLTYPSSFAEAKERRIKLSGEAYFEIEPDKTKPFIVSTQDQEVEVLGTHFNISAFADERETRTTLVEGLVEVRLYPAAAGQHTDQDHVNTFRIFPNEQTVLTPGQFHKQFVNVERVIAWKNGYFLFEDESIERIMKDISKWYGVEVRYEGKITIEKFNGMISRDRPISGVLAMLEKTGAINFKIKDKTVFVLTN